MEKGIQIFTNKHSKNYYRGSGYLGTAAFFCGVLSVLLFFGGLDAVSFSKEIVYTFAFVLSLAMCYTYYSKPRLSVIVYGIVISCITIIFLIIYEDIKQQIVSVYTAFSEGAAATRNVTFIMCVITVLLVGLFFMCEFVFKLHSVLSLLLLALLIASLFLKIKVTVFNVFAVIIYQLLFFIINNSLASGKRKIYSSRSAENIRGVLNKSAVAGVICIVTAFTISGVIMKTYPQPAYDLVSGAQETFYRIMNTVTGKGADINVDGSVSIGNNYQTGVKQLRLEAGRKPEEDLYLIGYRGGGYTGNNWSRADDVKICTEADLTQSQAEKYITGVNASRTYNNMYYSCNYLLKSNGLTISKEKDRRIELNIEYMGDRKNIRLEPYCSSLYGTQSFSVEKQYNLMYYEQKDMLSDWHMADVSGQDRIEDYKMIQKRYKDVMSGYYKKYSAELNPKLSTYVSNNPLMTLSEKTTFIIYTLMSNTSYTRTPGIMLGGEDVAEKFLFETQRGYCVHYATTATLMYRMYGIPARYVTGYKISPDSFKQTSDGKWTTDVTDVQQHAWTEIFIDNYGWVPVDMTPSTAGAINVSYPGYNMDTFNSIMEEHNWSAASTSLYKQNTEDVSYVRTWQGALRAGIKSFFKHLFYVVRIAALAAVIVMILGSPVLLGLRRKAVLKRQNKKRCGSIYAVMIKMLHSFGYVCDYDGTEQDFADVLTDIFGNEVQSDIRLAVETAIEAEFSVHRVDEARLMNVYDTYKEISAIVYERLGWMKKLLFKYIYCYGTEQ